MKNHKMKQSEYLQAIDRAKDRMNIKNTFYVKQLEDVIEKEKWQKNFWKKKYRNLLQVNQKGYNILMDYFDYIPEEEKESVDKKLKEIGL